LLPWVGRAGDIDLGWRSAAAVSSLTSTADAGSWTQTCCLFLLYSHQCRHDGKSMRAAPLFSHRQSFEDRKLNLTKSQEIIFTDQRRKTKFSIPNKIPLL